MPELELTLVNAHLSAATDGRHVILVDGAELRLPQRQPLNLCANWLRSYQVRVRILPDVYALHAQVPATLIIITF